MLVGAAEGVGWEGVQRMHPTLWPHSDLDGVTRRTAGTAELQASGAGSRLVPPGRFLESQQGKQMPRSLASAAPAQAARRRAGP